MLKILEDLLGDTKIKLENKENYVILCKYYNEEPKGSCKHFKKLKKKFKKEIKGIINE